MSFLVGVILKYVLPVLGVIALLFGVFEYGKSQGYDVGHQAAWDTQQQAINKLVAAQQLAADENDRKISGLELDANMAQQEAEAQAATAAKLRKNLAASYKSANPQVAASCGWSGPTISTINQILSTVPAGADAASTTGVTQ
jgi:hypothetical protein